MQKQNKITYRRLILTSSMIVVLTISLLFVSVYAWFTLTNINSASLVSSVSGVEAEYEFYIYNNMMHDGSSELTLENNVCIVSGEDLCYEYISNPTYAHLIDGKVAPGEKFSFAIKITSIGTSAGRLQLDLGGLQSIGNSTLNDKIQQAFSYEVTKISYIENGVESVDQKDVAPISYFSQTFTSLNDEVYPLVNYVPMGIANHLRSIIVVYFDIYFDPTIYGSDAFGTPYTNSNIFMNQTFIVNHIYMIISA